MYCVEEYCLYVIPTKKNLLRKGESFYIRGDESHYLKNDTDKKAVVLWVSTPPEF